jgi:hypothetical protein
MGIYEDIQKGQEQSKDMFQKALPTNINEVIEDIKKAKAAQLGEVRTWSGVKMRKEANGWVPVKDGSKGSGQAEEGKEGSQEPQTIEDAAKSASETALTNATKMSSDPKVREAAHKELMRRKSEEAQETFKAPEGSEGKKESSKANDENNGDAPEMKQDNPKKEEQKANFEEGNLVSFNKDGKDYNGKVVKVIKTNDGDIRYRVKDTNGNEHSGLKEEDMSEGQGKKTEPKKEETKKPEKKEDENKITSEELSKHILPEVESMMRSSGMNKKEALGYLKEMFLENKKDMAAESKMKEEDKKEESDDDKEKGVIGKLNEMPGGSKIKVGEQLYRKGNSGWKVGYTPTTHNVNMLAMNIRKNGFKFEEVKD